MGGNKKLVWIVAAIVGLKSEAVVSACSVENKARIGDGFCDSSGGYNTAECGWDGGDCCRDSCVPSESHKCTAPMDCKDPETALFTVVFLSDLETNYRGHTAEHAKRVITYIKDLKNKGVTYDGEFAGVKADPALVVHGGDISADAWSCKYSLGPLSCRNPDRDMKEVWNQLYDAGIPLLSAFGNHDWASPSDADSVFGRPFTDAEKTESNEKTLEFVKDTFDRTESLCSAKQTPFSQQWFAPKGLIGMSTAKVLFRGLQISMHMNHPFTESYTSNTEYDTSEQFAAHSAALDRSKPTMFVSHYPISHMPDSTNRANFTDLIAQFPLGTHHFSGHTHTQNVQAYNS